MRSSLQGRGGLITKLVLTSLIALSLLPLGCSQGGIVEGEVHYKMVNGMKDRVYTILVLNEPRNGEPSIVVNVEEEIRDCFPSEGNLVVDSSTEQIIEGFYTKVEYIISLHLMAGGKYTYYQAYRADREDFNKLTIGSKVSVDTEPSDMGPRIKSIVG